MTNFPIDEAAAKAIPDELDWMDVECWQCGGTGKLAGCFEDCCVCGYEDEPDLCCSPSRCDVCNGKVGWKRSDKGELERGEVGDG